MPRREQAHVRSDQDLISDVDTTDVAHRAVVVDEHLAADTEVHPVVDADRRDETEALIHDLTGELGPRRSDRTRVRVRDLVQALAAGDRSLDPLPHQPRLGSARQDQNLIGHWHIPGIYAIARHHSSPMPSSSATPSTMDVTSWRKLFWSGEGVTDGTGAARS